MSIRARDRALDQFRAALARQGAVIDKNWDAALTGSDPEALHDLRVAMRRTRALLANSAGVIPRRTRERFARGFRDLGRSTTAARDFDVLLLDWQENADRVDADLAPALGPVHDELIGRHRVALESVRAALAAPASAQLLAEWHAWLEGAPRYRSKRAKRSLQRVAWRRLKRLRTRLEERSRDPSVEGQHAWRKDAKQLRYLLEAFAHLFEDKQRRRLLKDLMAGQESLGRRRDVLVQVGLINAIASDPHLPEESKSAAGQLADRLGATSGEYPDPRAAIARRLKKRLRRLRT